MQCFHNLTLWHKWFSVCLAAVCLWCSPGRVKPVEAVENISSEPVVLTVDLTRDRRPISPYLYGVNIANWSAGYYLERVTQQLKEADVTVVRLGATNMERYNFKTNRMYNVISRQNDYVPLSWESFVEWARNSLGAEPFLQASVYGNVAGPGAGITAPDYSLGQSSSEVTQWAGLAGKDLGFWGVGNEPWIAWKRDDYPDIYRDAAHGDQVLNAHTAYDYYFDRFASVAGAIKAANPDARILGPTPANWWLYWTNDYSPLCPVTEPGGAAMADSPLWQIMMDPVSTWDTSIFPDRGADPYTYGWESDPRRGVCQYLSRMKIHEDQTGVRLADYLDVHRYIRAITDRDAIQEPRGLFQEDFESWDMETQAIGIRTNILNRLRSAVDAYYPGTRLSFSEYGYFYWNGYPSLAQITAVGTVDYLGFFARAGVDLACNWYVGEPNQSGTDFAHAVDSAKQAMFDETGQPNPKYWAFYLMSHWFRGTVVDAQASDWEKFSIHACQRDSGDIVIVVAYKGMVDGTTGDFIQNQSPVAATIHGLPDDGDLVLSRLMRFGLNDPGIIDMDTRDIALDKGSLTYTFHPLALYAFVFSPMPDQDQTPGQPLVTPSLIQFGPYDTGVETTETNTRFTRYISITNTSAGSTSWSISENAPWLLVLGDASGSARVTDRVYLGVDRSGLAPGTYETDVWVKTGTETTPCHVSMEVIPGEADGEKRFSDFETGSLAHSWNIEPPYAVGWWDGHGGPGDRSTPYIYDFSLDTQGLNRLGGVYTMTVDFDRSNGDTDSGRLFQSFGTYGHETRIVSETTGETVTYTASGNWDGYDAFAFDIRTETLNSDTTDLLLVLSDASGNKGKPVLGTSSHTDLLTVEDGPWQTITIPLDNSFYDWRYPEAQDGTLTQLDFKAITQIELIPWAGGQTQKGRILLDNLRVIRAIPGKNRFPVALASAITPRVKPGESITLDGSSSYDPDGSIVRYAWNPGEHLSDPESPQPVFSTDTPGTYALDLVVTDDQGVESRNIVQVMVKVGDTSDETDIISVGDGASGQGCFISVLETPHPPGWIGWSGIFLGGMVSVIRILTRSRHDKGGVPAP